MGRRTIVVISVIGVVIGSVAAGRVLPESTARGLVIAGVIGIMLTGASAGADYARTQRAWMDYQAKRREVPVARRAAFLAGRSLAGRAVFVALVVLVALAIAGRKF